MLKKEYSWRYERHGRKIIALCLFFASITSFWFSLDVTVPADALAETADYLTEHRQFSDQYKSNFETIAASGSAEQYYGLSYPIIAMAKVAEASKDKNDLEKVKHLVDLMLDASRDLNGDGKLEWSLDQNNNPVLLHHLQAATAIAATAVVMTTTAEFRDQFKNDAERYKNFVDRDIMRYWYDKNEGKYKPNDLGSWPYIAGRIPYIGAAYGGVSEYPVWNDKTSLAGITATLMYQAGAGDFYLDLASRIGRAFRDRLHSNGEAWIWSDNVAEEYWERYGYYYENAHDTSHANREPMMMVFMFENGIVFEKSDVVKMARTLTDVIWNGSTLNPDFSNYINGSNAQFYDTPENAAVKVGTIYFGWALLGKYSAEAQRAVLALFQAVKNGKAVAQNNSSYGKVCLAGYLYWNTILPPAPQAAPLISPIGAEISQTNQSSIQVEATKVSTDSQALNSAPASINNSTAASSAEAGTATSSNASASTSTSAVPVTTGESTAPANSTAPVSPTSKTAGAVKPTEKKTPPTLSVIASPTLDITKSYINIEGDSVLADENDIYRLRIGLRDNNGKPIMKRVSVETSRPETTVGNLVLVDDEWIAEVYSGAVGETTLAVKVGDEILWRPILKFLSAENEADILNRSCYYSASICNVRHFLLKSKIKISSSYITTRTRFVNWLVRY